MGIWCDTKLRRPERNETLYFGHAKDRYANPDEPNFAFMRLYEKTTDQGSRLPPKKTSVRVGVSLNEAGCRHFGLRTPTDVFEFNFSNLSDYFRLVRPVFVTPRLRSRLRKSIHTAAHKKLAELVTAKQLAIVEDQARTAGVWSLHNANCRYYIDGVGAVQCGEVDERSISIPCFAHDDFPAGIALFNGLCATKTIY